eukprot:m.348436 g.348436  ORF g.348436 m.348436 type:complete len:938 (+) comp16147_c0_seq42:3069-5882(+)
MTIAMALGTRVLLPVAVLTVLLIGASNATFQTCAHQNPYLMSAQCGNQVVGLWNLLVPEYETMTTSAFGSELTLRLHKFVDPDAEDDIALLAQLPNGTDLVYGRVSTQMWEFDRSNHTLRVELLDTNSSARGATIYATCTPDTNVPALEPISSLQLHAVDGNDLPAHIELRLTGAWPCASPDTGNNTQECAVEMARLFEQFNSSTTQQDVVRFFDSWGKPPADILGGNVRWLGGYEECLGIDTFDTNYCVVVTAATIYNTPASVIYGLCVPAVCDNVTIADWFNKELNTPAANAVKEELEKYGLTSITNATVRCNTPPVFSAGGAITVVVITLFVALAIGATTMDVLGMLEMPTPTTNTTHHHPPQASIQSHDDLSPRQDQQTPSDPTSPAVVVEVPSTPGVTGQMGLGVNTRVTRHAPGLKHSTSLSGLNAHPDLLHAHPGEERDHNPFEDEGQPSQNDEEDDAREDVPMLDPSAGAHSHHASAVSRHCCGPKGVRLAKGLLQAFSVKRSLPKLLNTTRSPQSIHSLDGIRVLSMMWVVLGHTYLWAEFAPISNIAEAINMFTMFSFQPIANGFYSVDSFLFLSGFLVSLTLLSQLKKRKGKFPALGYVFHRLIRLTPTVAVFLLMWINLQRHLGNGPLWSFMSGPPPGCADNQWWPIITYINNFYPKDLTAAGVCAGHLWYLAVDWDLYLIAPFLIVPLYKNQRIGLIVSALIALTCIVASGAITAYYNLSTLGNVGEYYRKLYVTPWARAQPYFVGILTAYLYSKVVASGKTLPSLRFYQRLLILLVALVLGFLPLYGLYGDYGGTGAFKPLTKAGNVAYFMFARLSWGLMLGLVTLLCQFNYLPLVNTFLSWPGFAVLSRLTFAAYLFHPMVLNVYYFSMRSSQYVTAATLFVLYLGVMIIVYTVSFAFTLFFEFPLAKTFSVLLSGGKPPHK